MRERLIPAVAVIVLAAGCGSNNSTPAASTTATAVATPTPTPVPTPVPVTLGLGVGCGLAPLSDCSVDPNAGPEGNPEGVWGCCTKAKDGNTFTGMVYDAIGTLQNEQPQLFNGINVLDRVKYQQGVARILERDYHVCAKPGGPGDEVAVKNTNDYSEQYDIFTAQNTTRYPGYTVTCKPARF